jgi:choice-of-anchor A domain-containing protein
MAMAMTVPTVGTIMWLTARPAAALAPVNPVEVPLAGHPANSGFLVFVEGNVTLRNDESEGTTALGGTLSIRSNYNIAAGSPPARSTFTAPGDDRQTFLYVGRGISWPSTGSIVNVENGGFTKVADTATYSAFNRDNNNAQVNYRLVPNGQPYNTNPHIDGRTNLQTPASIGTPVPSSLIDIPGAFALYRDLTQQMAACPQTLIPTDAQGVALPRPLAPGSSIFLTLAPGQTNVLNLTAAELGNLSQITLRNTPTASAPLLVNVSGASYNGNMPNLAGVSGNQAPFMMWNFAQATSIHVVGGATVEGTLYAPNATLTWAPTQNIEGNIIAANFNHGEPNRNTAGVREVHDFPFATTLACATAAQTAHLTLVKTVTNDDGGTAVPADWTLSAQSSAVTISGTTGSDAVTNAEVPPGTFDLTESGGPPDYVASDWTCDGGTLNGSSLTLVDGDDVTCTINNDDQPVVDPVAHLSLVKHVVNDDGGTASRQDWTLNADGPTPISGTSGSGAVTVAPVDPGSYDLSETDGPPGYDASSWVCTGGGSQTGSTVTLESGDSAVCTITNDDEPAHLTLVKQVVNDDGGTATPQDWTLGADGPTLISGVSGSAPVTDAQVPAGTYEIFESDGPPGYAVTSLTCDGGTVDGATVTVANGESATCTLVNDDTPAPVATLTLVKQVINDDGGTANPQDWTLSADGPTPLSGASGSDPVTLQAVPPGDYTLSEKDGPPGYTSHGWTCVGATETETGTSATVMLADGDDAVCTVVNDDDAVAPSPSPSASPTATASPTTAPSTGPSDASTSAPGQPSPTALPLTGGPGPGPSPTSTADHGYDVRLAGAGLAALGLMLLAGALASRRNT